MRFLWIVLECAADSKTPTLVLVELLDALFDVFAEDDSNDLLRDADAIKTLGRLKGPLKRAVRGRSVAFDESSVCRVEEVADNLEAFIDYKRQHNT
ncbi:unnamed protein product [Vitrella brassicaformis CCMP3155]|uniref:SYO1-like TPR repeats domain-containing protein n=1 Tax=Vitrella brassicaformis (strain CCMP3155) TaxID=1169540 RepID=A0A0G4H485_VITBC|nr:unnamed protein product [Vitrella brassicaformis CCMP3155]|eukprot:CEM38572.1 unnamed protein product [Vitrella brassicaformis CCMP3155]